MDRVELANRYGYHPATEQTLPQHQKIRGEFFKLALLLDELLPDGRTKDLVHTELENAAMWANKAIASQVPLTNEDVTHICTEDCA